MTKRWSAASAIGGLAMGVVAIAAAGCAGGVQAEMAHAHSPETVGFPSVPGPPSPPANVEQARPEGVTVPVIKVATGGNAGGAATTLILYDTTNTWGYLGELYAMYTANLAGHFGTWTAKPVAGYASGDIGKFTATVYIGSTYGEPLPAAFLTDVLAAKKPVIWLYDNIWQLVTAAGDSAFRTSYGWDWLGFTSYTGCPTPPGRCSLVNSVTYKGRTVSRDGVNNQGGIMDYSYFAAPATALATATRDDGTTQPWAVRSKTLTYVGELPFTYTRENDRMLVFADLLFDALAPTTTARHRALVRIEDVGPDADPTALRQFADWLYSQGVPFSVAVYPVYTDPLGYYNNGVPKTLYLHSEPSVVSALKYMEQKGGTLLMHGYTHQYSNVHDAVSGVSADDFEFYLAHIANPTTATPTIVMDGPTTIDTTAWAAGRVTTGLAEFAAAGLAAPTVFEVPHYAASSADYAVLKAHFAHRYERSIYFSGQLAGTPIDPTKMIGQLFPYSTTDVYGMKVTPENLGDYEPEEYYGYPPRLAADIVGAAQANLVVRDGIASFFIHTYDGLPALQQIVGGIQTAGYAFVAAATL